MSGVGGWAVGAARVTPGPLGRKENSETANKVALDSGRRGIDCHRLRLWRLYGL